MLILRRRIRMLNYSIVDLDNKPIHDHYVRLDCMVTRVTELFACRWYDDGVWASRTLGWNQETRLDARSTRTRSTSSSSSRLVSSSAGCRLSCTQCHSIGTRVAGITLASTETLHGVATPAGHGERRAVAKAHAAARFRFTEIYRRREIWADFFGASVWFRESSAGLSWTLWALWVPNIGIELRGKLMDVGAPDVKIRRQI